MPWKKLQKDEEMKIPWKWPGKTSYNHYYELAANASSLYLLKVNVICHRAPGWAPCILQQIPTGYLFYTWECICFHATFSIHPNLSFPSCVLKSVLSVWVSIPALQIGSSVPFF